MKINLRPASLSSDFFLFSLVIFMIAAIFPIGFWYEIYRTELTKKYNLLPAEARRIGLVLIDSIDYTAKYAQFLGERIVQRPNDLNYIASMISGKFFTQSHEQNLYTTTFDWVTPDNQLRVSSKQGVLAKPFDMSDREYLKRTPRAPWTFQLAQPRLGGLSQQWIIPAGMGVTDKRGNFLGSITLGFSVDGLVRRISEIIGQSDIRYVVVSDNNQLILDSKTGNTGPDKATFIDLSRVDKDPEAQIFSLSEPIRWDGVDFSFYHKVPDSPYVILVGYDAGMASKLFNQIVLSRIAEFSVIVLAAFFMLYMMRRRLINPVTQLADMADKIIEGKKVTLVGNDIKEIALLDRHLQRIATYVENEQRITTELIRQTRALEAANAEAMAAVETARRADQAKSEFLANMSHELRTPMNAVIGLTNILLTKKHSPEKERECLQVMQTSAQHLMQLINDLLDISKLEAGKVELERIPFNLQEVAKEVASINEIQTKQKNITLNVINHIEDLPLLIGDPLRLSQVLMNLVGNAVKFTHKGSVTIDIEGKNVAGNYDITISIIDTGIGIPQDKIDAIFQKFSQANSSISRTHGGTGLGLSISEMLVHSMGGSLRVESKPGVGSRFSVHLSLPVATEKAASEASTTSSESASIRTSTLHVLLAEDNAANILVATTVLSTFGYTYDIARNGRDALNKLFENRYDIALMDVQMPEIDGLEVTRLLREHEKSLGKRRVPVIGITAYALAEDRKRCMEIGMDEYISKPFDPNHLIALIERLAKNRSSTPAAA